MCVVEKTFLSWLKTASASVVQVKAEAGEVSLVTCDATLLTNKPLIELGELQKELKLFPGGGFWPFGYCLNLCRV